MFTKFKIDIKVIGIIVLSYFAATFPLVNYIEDPVILQDVGQYIYNTSHSYFRLVTLGVTNLFDYFKNEWLWAYSAVYISDWIGSPEIYFMVIGGINFFIYSYFIYKRSNLKAVLLLLIPIQIVFLIYQPRLSFGCSLWLAGLMTSSKLIRNLLFVLSLMTHNAIFVIIGSYWVLQKIFKLKKDRFNNPKKVLLTISFSLLVNFIVGPMISIFSNLLGKQRGGYEEGKLSASVTSSFFWGLLSIFLIIDYLRYYNDDKKYHLIGVFFTLFPVFSYMMDAGYPYRFLTVGMPFVIIGIMKSNVFWRAGLLTLYILFGLYTSINFYK